MWYVFTTQYKVSWTSWAHSTRNAHTESQEVRKDLGICWYDSHLDSWHYCEESENKPLWRAQQDWDCWTDWYNGWGPALHHFAPQTMTVSLLPGNIVSLVNIYLCAQTQSILMPKDLHWNCNTTKVWQSLLCWGQAWNRCLGCNIRHCHYFTRIFSLIFTDSKVCHRTNEHFFRVPAQQCCMCWLVGSVEEQGKLSFLTGLACVVPHGTPSTSDHPFRKAVWIPWAQDGGCQFKKKNQKKPPWTSHFGTETASVEYFLDSEHCKVCSFSATVLVEEGKSLQIFWEISGQQFSLIFFEDFEEVLNSSLTRITFP